MDITKEKSNPNPREKANLLSVIFFGYSYYMFKKGFSKTLEVEDLYSPLKIDRSKILGNNLQRNWEKQIQKSKMNNLKPSLLRALIKTFWLEYVTLGVLIVITDLILAILEPLVLGALLNYFKPETETTKGTALVYAGIISLINISYFLFGSQYLLESSRSGMRIRTACCALIYRKAVKLSKTALGDTASGKIVNLLSNDVSRFDIVSSYIHQMWIAPTVSLIIMGILYKDAGFAGLIGVLVVFVVVYLGSYTGKLSAKYRKQTATRTDERVRLMDEIISGIQVIKMYAWEKPFKKIIRLARQNEIKSVRKASYVRATNMAFNLFTTRLALFCTMLTLTLTNEQITVSKAFVFMTFFNQLSLSMSTIFTRGVSEIAELLVAIRRIRDFLLNEEFDTTKTQSYTNDTKIAEEFGDVISIQNVTVKWNPTCSENVLENINLHISDNKLIGIIGPVGSGKSSLLQTILGELEITKGDMKIHGEISYASQEPWVFGATIRQNILFGEEYNKKRYQEVVHVCALESDFEQFEDGDLTIVGDRGASLSGGQKARINLARTVYRNVDIYLLDDPLSAVDIHVSKHLYEKCINGFLANKTRVLVTHQVHYLKDADHLIILKNGRIEDRGTFSSLASSNNEYAKLLTAEPEISESENIADTSKYSRQLSQKDNLEEHGSLNTLEDGENVCTKLLTPEAESTETEEKTDRSSSYISLNSLRGSLVNISKKLSYAGSALLNNLEGEGEEQDKKENEILLKDLQEESSKGKVRGSLLIQYMKLGSNLFAVTIVAILFLGAQLTASGVDYWMSYWVSIEELRNKTGYLNSTVPYFIIPSIELTTDNCIYIYAFLLITLFLVAMSRSLLFYKLATLTSKKLHSIMFDNVVGATMRFFDSNPGGRILNRFSKDMGAIDEFLPKSILDAGQMLLTMFGSVLLITIIKPYFLVMIFFLSVVFGFMRHVYLKSSKDIKRLEGIMRSPAFTHLKATIEGLTTIRAFGAQNTLTDEFDRHQDYHSSACYMYSVASTVFGFYLNAFCAIFLGALTFSFLVFEEAFNMKGGEVGLAITQAIILTGYLQWGMRQSAEVVNQLMSVERVLEYKHLPKEVQPATPKIPSKDWPSKGEIILKDTSLRYFENGPLVLKHLDLTIKAKEKVGVVGRTGAGKSSLIQALFRLAPVEGSIKIDDIDTKDITLDTLRLKISIIPQDPVLFSGTLRYNLDPFEEYTDEVLYKAIGDVELKDSANIINNLDNKVTDRGCNYSVGQRQLICLARAILKKNKILMLDEATANVDPQTDLLIQNTIRKKFVDCTVITVAHRLNTIMDSDKVLVMDAGRVIEFDHPHLLLQNQNGVFYNMVMGTDKATSEQLTKIASHSYHIHVAISQ